MPPCKNNTSRYYVGNEPSPKGLGYCASGEKDGKIMNGRDGNIWIVKNGRWIEYHDKYRDKLEEKLIKFWLRLANGDLIAIYKDGYYDLITSSKKSCKAKNNEIMQKWKELNDDKNVKAIIWSAQSRDVISLFIDRLIKKSSKSEIKKLIEMKDLVNFLLINYKKYFEKYEFVGDKDYHLKN